VVRVKEEFEVTYFDPEEKAPKTLKGKDFEDQIDKLKRALEAVLKKMQKLGDYEINEFTAKVGIELGIFILKADGSISITWEK
jgi:hypothetical protein